MMYLYDTPRDTMAKDQMLESLFSTSTSKDLGLMPNTSNYLFMCSRAFCSTQFINHSSVSELLAQHKTSHRSCATGSMPNTKHFINHVLQGTSPTQPAYIYISICIINNWITPNIQKKSSCSYAVESLTQYKIKHQYNHHGQYAHAYKR